MLITTETERILDDFLFCVRFQLTAFISTGTELDIRQDLGKYNATYRKNV
jgi:hypothetical protein